MGQKKLNHLISNFWVRSKFSKKKQKLCKKKNDALKRLIKSKHFLSLHLLQFASKIFFNLFFYHSNAGYIPATSRFEGGIKCLGSSAGIS